ncbi:sialate O-acetylesterase [Akkermansiaceae bacterium]|nr:sialate O-acetylesterase [Akkermansiaceae bacterium]
MKITKAFSLVATLSLGLAPLSQAEQALSDPDGKPADMGKPVKVYLLMGQSNMLGFGKVAGDKDGSLEHAVKTENLYPFLIDDSGNWTTRQDVRNVFTMGSGGPGGGVKKSEWLTISGGKIGPEIGIGHHLGALHDEPVLILKSCIGNRSLGWDILAPGSPSYEYEETDKKGEKKTMVYAGYGQSPLKWEKGTEPKPIGWKAGVQYDGDIDRAKKVLADLEKHYPGAKGYEVAGFFWWQGDKDRYNEGHAAMYEKNLGNLFKALRKEFNAPTAKMVVATLGQTDKANTQGNEKLIIDAMFSFADAHKGEASTVYTHPLSKGGASNSHYGGNAQTYMNVGLAMGQAMVDLLKK